MPIVTLRDLYIAELQDLFDAERQAIEVLPAMAAAATSTDLRDAFTDHLEETRVQVQRLELLLRRLDVSRQGQVCEGLRGLVAEGKRRIADTERGQVLDAALIGAAQRIEHYEIAAYGCARAYARTLGDPDAEELLQQTLDEEGAADHRLSRLAERGINQSAGEDEASDAERQRARLRFVPAGELREFTYRDFRIRNARGEDLGHLDGLVVESRSDRPLYFVVDSGGWFVGHRYLVPVGLLRVDEASRTLQTDLDRQTIRSYPPFNSDTVLRDDAIDVASCDASGDFMPPTWLMTGVWMTEGSGFAACPPRAHSDLAERAERPSAVETQRETQRSPESYPENELMMARGEPEGRGEVVERQAPPDSGDVQPRDTERPPSTEPRIERYRER